MQIKRNWRIGTVLALSLAVGLTACQATPEEDVIVQKAELEERLTQAAETEAELAGESLRVQMGIPETVSFSVASSDGRQTYTAEDAPVNVPDTDKASTATAVRDDFTDADTQIWTEAFFGDAEVWVQEEYVMTKQEYLDEIKYWTEQWELEKDSVEPEYYEEWEASFQQTIDSLTAEMETAPETAPEPVHETPEYKLTPNENYQSMLEEGESGFCDQFCISGVLDGYDCSMTIMNADWGTTASFFKNVTDFAIAADNWVAQGLEVPNNCRYSEEEAVAMVKELLEQLQPGNNLEMKTSTPLYQPELIDAGSGEEVGEGSLTLVDTAPSEYCGYEFRFVREINGLHENTTWYAGTDDEEAEADYVPFGYETVSVNVTDDGIISFYWQNRMAQGELIQENVALLPFEQIQSIVVTQLPMLHAGWDADESYQVVSLDLGLMCVRKPNDNQSFTMVPVWDVYCGWINGSGTYSGIDVDTGLTINAVDGSIINRGLRY